MKHIDPAALETAFVPASVPMFADLIPRLAADESLSPSRRRDLVSALHRIAEALDRPLERVPADPTWLRPRLSRIEPAALRLSRKSWSNILSCLRAALAHVGITHRPYNRKTTLAPDWRILWEAVLATDGRGLKAGLGRFVYFLDGLGIPPTEVTSAHALAFRDALALNEVSRDPEQTLTALVSTWNHAIARIPGWPETRLVRPSRRKVLKPALADLPASFAADLDRYVASLERPDPLDPDARLAPLRTATVRVYRDRLLRFAGALLRADIPAAELSGLAALVAPDRCKFGLRWMLAQNGGQTSVSIDETAQLLQGIARRYLRVPAEVQGTLDTLASRVAMPPQKGMTEKNRARLRPLRDPDTRRRLLGLPEVLMARAEAMGQGTQGTRRARAARLSERAVAIAILRYCPVRVQNLAAIHLERHLQRPGGGRVFLTFTPREVKNRQPLEFEMPPVLVALIERHLALREAALCPPGTPWLFPRRDGSGPMDPNQLSNSVFDTIRKETGLEVNVHLFRHFAAMLILEADPGAYELVRRLLGHARLSRVIEAYTGFETDAAARFFGALVDRERGK